MFSAFLKGIFIKHWKTLLVVFVILGCIGGGWWYITDMKRTIVKQQKEITQLTNKNQILEENNKKLTNTIGTVNTAIDKLSDTTMQMKGAFTQLNKTVTQQSTDLSNQLAHILTDKAPATCEETITYLISAIKEYQK